MASLIQEVTKRIPRPERGALRQEAQRFWRLVCEDMGRSLDPEDWEAASTPEKDFMGERLLSGKGFKECYLAGGLENVQLVALLAGIPMSRAYSDIYLYYSVLKLKFANQKSGARGHLALVRGENDDR